MVEERFLCFRDVKIFNWRKLQRIRNNQQFIYQHLFLVYVAAWIYKHVGLLIYGMLLTVSMVDGRSKLFQNICTYVNPRRMGQGRGVYRFLVGKPEWKRPVGRPRRRWEDNIKIDFQEVGGGCGDWMELAQDRDRWPALVSTVMNFRVSKMRRISWLAAEPVSFSRRTLLHGVSK